MKGLKMTNIEMDWTDSGARVKFSSNLPGMVLNCPRCQAPVQPSIEHLCGDRAPKPAKPRQPKRRKRGCL